MRANVCRMCTRLLSLSETHYECGLHPRDTRIGYAVLSKLSSDELSSMCQSRRDE